MSPEGPGIVSPEFCYFRSWHDKKQNLRIGHKQRGGVDELEHGPQAPHVLILIVSGKSIQPIFSFSGYRVPLSLKGASLSSTCRDLIHRIQPGFRLSLYERTDG